MKQPIIGVAGNYLHPYNNRSLDFDMTYTPHGFIHGLQNAGAIPLVFPIGQAEEAKIYVEKVDGIVLAGGQDVSPFTYGEEPYLKLDQTNIHRDYFELAIIEEALRQKKPLLAVCRGFQIYNVALGGSLFQDVSLFKDNGTKIQHVQLSSPKSPVHTIELDERSWLAKHYGAEARVNSYHHQAIKTLADGITPVAWAKDGMLEAFEQRLENHALHVAVQWHPEWMLEEDELSRNLFKQFVNEVYAYNQ